MVGGLKTSEALQGFRMANLSKNAEVAKPEPLDAILSVAVRVDDVVSFHFLAKNTGLSPTELFWRLLMRGIEETSDLPAYYPKLVVKEENEA